MYCQRVRNRSYADFLVLSENQSYIDQKHLETRRDHTITNLWTIQPKKDTCLTLTAVWCTNPSPSKR